MQVLDESAMEDLAKKIQLCSGAFSSYCTGDSFGTFATEAVIESGACRPALSICTLKPTGGCPLATSPEWHKLTEDLDRLKAQVIELETKVSKGASPSSRTSGQ